MGDIITILLVHCFLDMPFHNCPLNKDKRDSKILLLFHSFIYGMGIHITLTLIGVSSWVNPFILIGSHFIIDYARELMRDSNINQKRLSLLDQVAHMAINFALLCRI